MGTGEDNYVWLNEACEKFGPKRLITAANREERAARKQLEMREIPEDPNERIKVAFGMLGKAFSARPAREALQAHVAQMLYRGELEARGIQVSPMPGLAPEPVPRHMFSDPLKIAWAGSRVKKSGRVYEEIEVRPAQRVAAVEPQGPRPNGRPSKQDEVFRLIDDITSAGFDLNSIGRKAACDRIRSEAAKREFNTDIGYSEPVLKRALTLKFGPRR